MAISLDVSGDFETVLDGTEQVTLKRRGTASAVVVPKAWRYSSSTGEATAGVRDVVRSDVVWQFAWDEAVARPTVGDAIIDGFEACWTILVIEQLGAKTRLRCQCRNLHVAYELDNRVELQQAIWDDPGSGPEIVGWSTWRAAVPARIQPHETTVDATADPPTSTATYRITLGEALSLDHNHRIVGSDGAVYQLVDFSQAERIDALPVATAVKLVDP